MDLLRAARDQRLVAHFGRGGFWLRGGGVGVVASNGLVSESLLHQGFVVLNTGVVRVLYCGLSNG